MRRRFKVGTVAFALVALALLGSLGYLLALLLIGNAELVKVLTVSAPGQDFVGTRYHALPWVFLALLAAVVGLVLWWRERMPGDVAGQERDLRQRLESARRAEREMSRRLQRAIEEYRRERGTLGDPRDIPELLLRTGVTLLEAEKGILLSRDRDRDGELHVTAAVGFQSDPSESHLAQRFGEEVIERDTILRERGDALDDARRTAADEEVDNLIAIPIYADDEFSGVLVAANSRNFEEHDEEVLVAFGDHAGAILENGVLQGELRGSYLATVRVLAEAIRAKDPHLGGHSTQVSNYVRRVAERLGLNAKGREGLLFASLLHDVGKIGISERILLKPGPLNFEEFAVIQLHPRIGARLVQLVPALASLSPVILHHHERYDGTGYPAGLTGEEIPMESRIIAVVDAFSAMTSDRPYQGAMEVDDACREIERCAGTQFDPSVVKAFVAEVRADVPSDEDTEDALEVLLADPELQARRRGQETMLGLAPLELVDNLTMLYCRRHLHERAKAAAEQASIQNRPFSVAIFEIANIDDINRRSGYAAGDEAIRNLAANFDRIPATQFTAARYSGSRLALVLPDLVESEAEGLAETVLDSVDGEGDVRFGVATWHAGDDGEAVIERARHALAARSLAPSGA